MTRITCPAPDASGPSWLPLADAMSSDPPSVSAIRSGIAYLPFAVGVVIASALASQLVARIGPRPLIVAGSAMVAGGMFWFPG